MNQPVEAEPSQFSQVLADALRNRFVSDPPTPSQVQIGQSWIELRDNHNCLVSDKPATAEINELQGAKV